MTGRILVVEMDEIQCRMTAKLIENTKGLELIGATGDGSEALRLIREYHPDVAVCGMILNSLDGWDLLEAIAALPKEERPAVIVLSAVRQEGWIRHAFETGAADYLLKPCASQMLLRRIEKILCIRSQKEVISRHIEQMVSVMLLKLGIPAHVKGYRFLQEAVISTIREPVLSGRLMHELYPGIAQKYQTTTACVERSIRNAIHLAWERGRPEEISRLLGRSVVAGYERPTSAELIALMAEKMRQTARR